MHRIRRIGAALLAVLMLSVMPGVPALAVLALPDGLAVIADDALSAVPVKALTLPEGLTELGDQLLNGLVYLRVNGKDTAIRLTSTAPRCVIAPSGSLAEAWAAELGVPFAALDTLHPSGGFYYAENGRGLTLLCAVDPEQTGGEVTIPKTVDGLHVTEVSAFAFAGCEALTAIDLPELTRESVTASATADCPSAAITYYSVSYRALLISESTFYRFNTGEENDGWIEHINRNAGDVSLMSRMLQSVTGPDGGRYSVTTADDQNQGQIHSLIASAFAGADEDDVSLFFIATHGDTYGDAEDYYAGALEMPSTDYDSWYAAELYLSDLASWLAAVPGKVIVVIEACGSGAAVYTTEEGYEENSRAASRRFSPARFDRQVIDAFADADPGITVSIPVGGDAARVGEFRESKFYVLTASRFQELSWGTEGSDPGNYFTRWLAQGVGTAGAMPADTDGSGTATLNELFLYVKAISDSYNFGTLNHPLYQHVQVYPGSCGYELFRR